MSFNRRFRTGHRCLNRILSVFLGLVISLMVNAQDLNISQIPLFLGQNIPPLLMLVMGRDHKLYYEAYNDASDLNGDGILDVGYNPDITYFGYFDPLKCYTYDSGNGRFNPVSQTSDKTCSGQWSGDFLNYLTTARIDALRKVLYGGYREVDSTTETVLERTYIPQDAHSWGKEYRSIDHDGYDIRSYAPLDLPAQGTRHLFANTTIGTDADDPPLLRVLTHSEYRIWEWVSIEQPVAGTRCLDGDNGPNCEREATAAETDWKIVPPEAFQNLTMTTYNTSGYNDHPANHGEYDSLIKNYAKDSLRFGSGLVNNIDGSGNPFGNNENYLSIFEGELVVPDTREYRFAVDGDDAVEVIINGKVVAGWYGGHGSCNCQSYDGTITLSAGTHDIEFRHQERSGGDNYYLYWETYKPAMPASEMTDYIARVKVCDISVGLEDNCQEYGDTNPTYKPVGILQEYGEDEQMLFGLITGSYRNNLEGGVLRKNIGTFTDEVDPQTGQFTTEVGIVQTIDKLRIRRFNGSSYGSCGWIVDKSLADTDNLCHDWGNPIAEMMYEGLRYFAGKAAPTAAFDYSGTTDDSNMRLPKPAWEDPYAEDNYAWCAKPVQLVISDINPSYDTDQLPGSAFSSFTGDVSGLNVSNLGDKIWANEPGLQNSQQVFIGQSGDVSDDAPTEKTVSGFGDIRGLSPEEPSKQGGYYAASVAYHALSNDIHPVNHEQTMSTFAVALASPLPRIEIPVDDDNTVVLVPFAKSVGGYGISGDEEDFQPTNTIVDFYVETIESDYGKFRINYEDVEQGADHDMDAIVEYEYRLNNDGTISITLNSTYAAGSIIQHLGYVISGTTADGIYLEVRDEDTSAGNDPDYYLDTPPGVPPAPNNTGWDDGEALPLMTTRVFTPRTSGTATAILLDNPLWYAAKWGGFQDDNGNDLPDQTDEWDTDDDGDPDNYFLVTNALGLRDQLDQAFNRILGVTSSSSSISTNSTRLDTDTLVYQARFSSEDWSGQLLAFQVENNGTLSGPIWDAADLMPSPTLRSIYTADSQSGLGIPFLWDSLTADQQAALDMDQTGTVDSLGEQRVAYLRGEQTEELGNGGVFRDRPSGVLGDIVNSDPNYVGGQNFGYDVLPDTSATSYESFLTTKRNTRAMLYVGANDGMLHGFDADTGEEILAYVPSSVISELNRLSSPDYVHRYYVDGPPYVGDAYLNSLWRTILLGTQGSGGRTVFALDVTDPDSFGSGDVLWELEHADLGYLASATIVRLNGGQWAALISNGYNSDSHRAKMLLVDLADASIIDIYDTEVGDATNPNGLSPVIPVDLDRDRITDVAYAGDLQGNVWKFDFTAGSANQWGIAYKQGNTPKPLATLQDANGNPQPITARPEVGPHPDGNQMVYVGTGKFFEVGDEVVPVDQSQVDVHSFYGLYDNGSRITGDRDQSLQVQEILGEVTEQGSELRSSTDTLVDYSNYRGWYMDLVSPVAGIGREGERVVSAPLLRSGRLIFSTLIPSEDPCEFGGSGWLMELSAVNGSRLDYPPLDLNDDGEINELDTISAANSPTNQPIPPSGKKSEVGIIKTPGIVSAGEVEYKYTSGSSGQIEVLTERGDESRGRQSWIQLR